MTRFIAILACITILDCTLGTFGFLTGWLPGPPIGGVPLWLKFVLCLVAIGVLLHQAARFAMWVTSSILARTGWLGREFGLAMIRGLTEQRGRHWARAALVRWIWLQVNGRRLKSVTTIAKRARGIEPVRRVRAKRVVPGVVPANDNWNIQERAA